MKVSTEKMENAQISVDIEADAEEMEKSLDKAYKRLVSKVSVPGFRKGKTPRNILEQHIGRPALLEEALEHLIPELYREALKSEDINPIAEPRVEISKSDPLAFKAIIPLQPTVTLGDYRSIHIEPETVSIGEAEIANAMRSFQERQAVVSPVERAAKKDDYLTIDVDASIGETPFLNHSDLVYEMNYESSFPLPGFAKQLEGMNKNEQREFSIQIPGDYSLKEYAGKECLFKVTVKEIKEKQLPELNDEFATGFKYESLDDMRQKITDELDYMAKQRSRQDLELKALEKVAEISQIEYPPILEEREIEQFLDGEMRRFRVANKEEYLEKLGKNEEEVFEELRPVARKRVINSLLLTELSKSEDIKVDAEEIDERSEQYLQTVKDREKMEKFMASAQVRSSIEQSLLTEKTVDLLIDIVSGSEQESTDKKEESNSSQKEDEKEE